MSAMAVETGASETGATNPQISIFVGNFGGDQVTADDLTALFNSQGLNVHRVDMKRGFAFVFADDCENKADIVAQMNGVAQANQQCQNQLRVELAQGTGSTKRNEDLRRSRISPSDTLFVVNFDANTTTSDDLSRLFSPFGALKRVDIPQGKNYAFVAFENQEDGERAREGTNGGKLNQNVITVEFVARKFNENAPPSSRGGRGGRGDRRYDDRRGPDRYDDRRGGYDDRRGGDRYDDRRGGDRYDDRRGGYDERRGGYDDRRGPDRYDDRRGPDRYDDRRGGPDRYDDRRRGGSPPRGMGGYDGGRGGGRRRSRSRSPPRGGNYGRGRSPSPGGGYNGGGYSLANPRGGGGGAPPNGPQGGRFRDEQR